MNDVLLWNEVHDLLFGAGVRTLEIQSFADRDARRSAATAERTSVMCCA
jgi:hypothetical protein